jgi:hypothetical protein
MSHDHVGDLTSFDSNRKFSGYLIAAAGPISLIKDSLFFHQNRRNLWQRSRNLIGVPEGMTFDPQIKIFLHRIAKISHTRQGGICL